MVQLEFTNPTGSMKDRMARAAIEAEEVASESGQINGASLHVTAVEPAESAESAGPPTELYNQAQPTGRAHLHCWAADGQGRGPSWRKE